MPRAHTEEEREKIFKIIIKKIAIEGKPIRTILKDKQLISPTTFYNWLSDYPTYMERYAMACDERAEAIFEETLEIADARGADTFIDKDGNEKEDKKVIARDRLRVDTRKWYLSKITPEKYGDYNRVDHTTKGESIKQDIDYSKLSKQTLEELAKLTENKD